MRYMLTDELWAVLGPHVATAKRYTCGSAPPELGDVRRVLIDSTIVRAHQHAAGARRRKKRSGRAGRQPLRVWAAAGAG